MSGARSGACFDRCLGMCVVVLLALFSSNMCLLPATNVDLLYYLADKTKSLLILEQEYPILANLWDIFEKSSHNMYIVHELRQVYSCSWIWV